MAGFHRLSLISSVSLGVGTIVGIYVERNIWSNKTNHNDISSEISHLKDYLPLPSVSAATSMSKPALALPPNRTSEIMQYGYPGLDNVKSFDNFVVSYDRRNRNPNWVFEHLKPEHVTKNSDTDRKKCDFIEDSTIHKYFRATNKDFKNSGFDRGHLAAAANHRHSQNAMGQTFYLSNISPQVGKGFNRNIWNDLEKYIRAIARKSRNVYVCTGPLYLPRSENDGKTYVKYQVIGLNNVAVPTHFFKVVVIENNDGHFEMLSYLLPNKEIPNDTPLKYFLVPPDTIERAAGFLLFDKLPKNRLKYINQRKA